MRRLTQFFFLSLATVGLAIGCGGSEPPSTGTAPENEPESQSSNGGEESAPADSSPDSAGTGTMTMADGTVFELEMTLCRTKINAPSFFLIEEGYDLSGRTSDGFRVGLLRAASTEEFAKAQGELRGELDENGNNAGIFYRFDEPESTFTVNGNTIMGDLIVTDFNSLNPIFGDSTTATIEIRCPDEG